MSKKLTVQPANIKSINHIHSNNNNNNHNTNDNVLKTFKVLEDCYKNENETGTMYQYFRAMNPPWGYRKMSEKQRRKMRLVVNRRLGKTHLSIREGPGRRPVPYLDGNTAVNLANEAFGIDGWRSEIISLEQDFLDVIGGRTTCSYTCVMRISLSNGSFRDGVGCGDSTNIPNKADAIDKAKKSACTDALKRALKQFGDGLGNSIEGATVIPEKTQVIDTDFEDWFDEYYDKNAKTKKNEDENENEAKIKSLVEEVNTLKSMISNLINMQTMNLNAEQLYREEIKEKTANQTLDLINTIGMKEAKKDLIYSIDGQVNEDGDRAPALTMAQMQKQEIELKKQKEMLMQHNGLTLVNNNNVLSESSENSVNASIIAPQKQTVIKLESGTSGSTQPQNNISLGMPGKISFAQPAAQSAVTLTKKETTPTGSNKNSNTPIVLGGN